MDPKARQFYDRALKACSYEEKLLCLYNTFFVLFNKGCVAKMAQVCSLESDTVKKAVDCCREDYEGERTVLSSSSISDLFEFLGTIQ